ncbi:hypothetical protein [Paenibacillus apiarius]|uniref:hypothetical protein n=1 Tax=Paenibacillus apiarius TaxID=46240 RepID=UPI001980FB50|nr:hypothetical protein [Paenibacillus apiarius]MBN3524548.1 hypothetical protein [Paenibacillus apiarius]
MSVGSKPETFRRTKLLNFLRNQMQIVQEASMSIQMTGSDPSDYVEMKMSVLRPLMDEFGVTDEEIYL